MKADKVVVKITIESLSIDVLQSMLLKVIEQVDQEVESGSIQMSDGDYVDWKTTRTPVSF